MKRVVVVALLLVVALVWSVVAGQPAADDGGTSQPSETAPTATHEQVTDDDVAPGRVRIDPSQGDEAPRHAILAAQLRNSEVRHADRRAAATALAGLGDEGLAELLSALGAPDETTHMAMIALATIEGLSEHALEQIARFLYDERFEALAAHALAEQGKASIPFALAALADERAFVQEAALYVLKQCGTATREGAVAAAVAIEDSRPGVRESAAWALGQMGGHADIAVPALLSMIGLGGEDRETALQALGRLGPAAVEAVPTLTRLLASSDTDARDVAMETLRAIGPLAVPAVPELLRLAVEERVETSYVTRVLGEIGPLALTRALTPEQSMLHADALIWLSDNGSEEFATNAALVAAVVALLDEEQPDDTRTRAVGALGALGVRSRADRVVAAVGDPSPNVRAQAVGAVGRLLPDGTAAIHALVRALADPIHDVQSAAVEALAWFGPRAAPAVPRLTALLASDRFDEYAIAFTLGRIGPAAGSARHALATLLEDESARARLAAGIALIRIVPPGTVAHPTLHALRVHDADGIRERLVEELGEVPTETLTPTLADRLSDRRPAVRVHAARALQKWGPVGRSAAPAIIARIESEGAPNVLVALIQALVAVDGDPAAAIQTITPLVYSGRRDVRAAAKDAFSTLGRE